MRKRGFTLLETMVVVLVIGVLLSIAIPQMQKARLRAQIKSCHSNQRIFDVVKSQWAMDQNIGGGTAVTLSDVTPYLKKVPVCPGGGAYDLGTTNTSTACTLPEHPPYAP